MKDELQNLRNAAEELGKLEAEWQEANQSLSAARQHENAVRNAMIEARKRVDASMAAFQKALPKESQ